MFSPSVTRHVDGRKARKLNEENRNSFRAGAAMGPIVGRSRSLARNVSMENAQRHFPLGEVFNPKIVAAFRVALWLPSVSVRRRLNDAVMAMVMNSGLLCQATELTTCSSVWHRTSARKEGFSFEWS